MRTEKYKNSKTEKALLVSDFVMESRDHIAAIQAGLVELKDNPNDQETLNRIFLAFHAMTRTAEFLDFTEIGSLARSAEKLLDFVRESRQVISSENINVISNSIGTLLKLTESQFENAKLGGK